MSLKERTINVDIMTKEYTKLKYKQGESGQNINIKLFKNGEEINLIGLTVNALFEKTNGEILEKSATFKNNVATITLSKQILNTAGEIKTELYITKGNELVISFTIIIYVEESINAAAAVEEKEEWDSIKDLLIKSNNLTMIDDNNVSNKTTMSSYKINSQLENIKSQIKEIENDGVSSSIVEEKVQSVINDKIDDGTLSNLTIADGSITYNKLDDDIKSRINQSYSSWLAIGDSITFGYLNNFYSYADIISKHYNLFLKKDAISGTNVSGDNSAGLGMVNRYSNNSNDYNLVTVMGGVNDYDTNVPLGEFDALAATTDTFYNGLVVLIKGLITKYPNSKIVYCTTGNSNTHKNRNQKNELGLSYNDYLEAIEYVCNYFAIPLCRTDKLMGFSRDAMFNGIGTENANSDLLHPLTPGHLKMASAITDFINFKNPISSWGKCKLEINPLISSFQTSLTVQEIKNNLEIKAIYENGLSFDLQNKDYDILGSLSENNSKLTIKYRNIKKDITLNVVNSPDDSLLYRLETPINFDGVNNQMYDTNFVPFDTDHDFTIHIKGTYTSNEDGTGFLLGVNNPTNLVQWKSFFINFNGYSTHALNILLNCNGGNVSTSLFKKVSDAPSGTILDLPPIYYNIFIIYNKTSLTIYNIRDNTIIYEKIQECTNYITSDWTLKFGVNMPNFIGTIDNCDIFNNAFTKQDVLNNI